MSRLSIPHRSHPVRRSLNVNDDKAQTVRNVDDSDPPRPRVVNNVRVPSTSRPMTVPEKYYAFLDLVWPTNPILSARLSVCPPVEQVEARWREFSARRVYTRLMPTSDLRIVDAGSSRLDFAARELPSAQWANEVAREADLPLGLERVVGLRYLASPDEGQSLMYLIGHHSVADGRGGLTELQAFLRFLDGREAADQDHLSRPPAASTTYPWQTDRRAFLDVLRELSARNRELGPPLPADWPEATTERVSRLTPITWSTEVSDTVLGRAREEKVRVFSSMASAWIHEVARTVCGTDEGVLQLNVPVDRSVPSDDPRRPAAMAVGVLGHRYRVRPDDQWSLARDVAATVQTALERGEGELFFQLARLDSIEDLDTGATSVGDAIRAAAPAVSVTNMGLLDASDDPPWVRAMWGNLAATPNQVISFSTVGYRGQLCSTLWTDDLRVPPDRTAALATGFADRLG